MGKVERDALVGAWTHAHEEDTPGTRVYRPATQPFPPSRGRDSFTLAPDGTLVERAIGPADRSGEAAGTWTLGDDDTLTLRAGGRSSERVLHVVSVVPDRLVFRR